MNILTVALLKLTEELVLLELKNPFSPKVVTGFRTRYSKIRHLDILNILSWRSLRKQQ